MIPRYRPVAHGGMVEAVDGRYVHVDDLDGAVEAQVEAAEQRGAERVFAALSVFFAAHPDFDRVLADFTARGLAKEGAADARFNITRKEGGQHGE